MAYALTVMLLEARTGCVFRSGILERGLNVDNVLSMACATGTPPGLENESRESKSEIVSSVLGRANCARLP